MARIPYVSRETMPDGRTDLYDRLVRERGANPENVFLALANVPDLAEAVLGMATALRKQTTLPRVFRELAVVTVGLEANASYEVDHKLLHASFDRPDSRLTASLRTSSPRVASSQGERLRDRALRSADFLVGVPLGARATKCGASASSAVHK